MVTKDLNKKIDNFSLTSNNEFDELLKLRTMYEVCAKSPHLNLFFTQINDISPEFITAMKRLVYAELKNGKEFNNESLRRHIVDGFIPDLEAVEFAKIIYSKEEYIPLLTYDANRMNIRNIKVNIFEKMCSGEYTPIFKLIYWSEKHLNFSDESKQYYKELIDNKMSEIYSEIDSFYEKTNTKNIENHPTLNKNDN